MRALFRSIINVKKNGKPTIDQVDLKKNYRAFLASRVEPEDGSYIKLYHWIEGHFREYEELPSIDLLHERAINNGEETVIAALNDIVEQTPYAGSDYRSKLKEKFREQCKDKMQDVLTKTWQVASGELKVGKKKIAGIPDACQYFTTETRKLRFGNLDVKTQGDIRKPEEVKEAFESYKKRKIDPLSSVGMYTFFQKIDDVSRGIKPGQVMLIAGYAGNGKSTLSANLVYNGMMQGYNGLFIPLEMGFEEMRDMVYVLHASNPEWFDNHKYKNMAGKLSYDKVRHGELNNQEEEFYEFVLDDFINNEGYGRLFIDQPVAQLTMADLELKAYDYNAQLQEEGRELDFILVDYVGLMRGDRKYSDHNEEINNIIISMKSMAMNFDNGRKVRIITPFQINREGWKEASKNDGMYKLNHLSGAHESERTCDLVIGCFMSTEMKKSGVIKIGCMKHRSGAEFDPFEARIDHNSKNIRDFIQVKTEEDGDDLIKEIPLD